MTEVDDIVLARFFSTRADFRQREAPVDVMYQAYALVLASDSSHNPSHLAHSREPRQSIVGGPSAIVESATRTETVGDAIHRVSCTHWALDGVRTSLTATMERHTADSGDEAWVRCSLSESL